MDSDRPRSLHDGDYFASRWDDDEREFPKRRLTVYHSEDDTGLIEISDEEATTRTLTAECAEVHDKFVLTVAEAEWLYRKLGEALLHSGKSVIA